MPLYAFILYIIILFFYLKNSYMHSLIILLLIILLLAYLMQKVSYISLLIAYARGGSGIWGFFGRSGAFWGVFGGRVR